MQTKLSYFSEKLISIIMLASLVSVSAWEVKNAHDSPIVFISFDKTGQYVYTEDDAQVIKKWTYKGEFLEQVSFPFSHHPVDDYTLARNYDSTLYLRYDPQIKCLNVVDCTDNTILISYQCRGGSFPCGAFAPNNYIALTGGGTSFYVLDFEFEKIDGCMRVVDSGVPFNIEKLYSEE